MNKDRYAILVVDDEESIRRLLQKRVGRTRPGDPRGRGRQRGLAQLRSHWFDVVITDLLGCRT